MLKPQEIADPTSCLNQAHDDEIVFVIRANDPLGAEIVEWWAERSVQLGIHLSRIEEARACAQSMRAWRIAHHNPLRQCPKCLGCGKIASSDEGEPWTMWEDLPPGSDLAVRLGLVFPIGCPSCDGTGRIPATEGVR